MRALVIAICLAAGAANAGESGVTVRQLAGISASVSDSGFGLGAQLGVRISPLLLRVTFDVAPSSASHFFPARRGVAQSPPRSGS
jgi:hypothetical protein